VPTTQTTESIPMTVSREQGQSQPVRMIMGEIVKKRVIGE